MTHQTEPATAEQYTLPDFQAPPAGPMTPDGEGGLAAQVTVRRSVIQIRRSEGQRRYDGRATLSIHRHLPEHDVTLHVRASALFLAGVAGLFQQAAAFVTEGRLPPDILATRFLRENCKVQMHFPESAQAMADQGVAFILSAYLDDERCGDADVTVWGLQADDLATLRQLFGGCAAQLDLEEPY